MKVFFSRRIGLDDQGEAVPIEWGVRLTGRAGGWNLGVLEVETDGISEPGREVPRASFSVVRAKRNLGGRSSIGAIVTNRDESGPAENRVYGLDFDYKPTSKVAFNGYWSKSDDETSTHSGNDGARGLGFLYQGPSIRAGFDAQEVEPAFNPGSGFLLRPDHRRYNPRFTFLPRLNRWGLRQGGMEAELDYYSRSSDGALESRRLEIAPMAIRTTREDLLRLAWIDETERLFVPFQIFPGVVIPPGIYRFDSWNFGGRTNPREPINFGGGLNFGDFFDGEKLTSSFALRLRLSKYWRTETLWVRNDVELPQGDFVASIYRQSFDVSFHPDMRINALVQFNDATDFLGANLRFNWTYRPGSDLYVVYNQNWDAVSFGRRETQSRQLIVKLTYHFQR